MTSDYIQFTVFDPKPTYSFGKHVGQGGGKVMNKSSVFPTKQPTHLAFLFGKNGEDH